MSGWVAGGAALGALGAGYLGAEGAKEAAATSAASTDRASALQMEQYRQNRQDLMPWMDAARGSMTGTTFNEAEYNNAVARYEQDVADLKGSFGRSNVAYQQERRAIEALGAVPSREQFTTKNYEGGALQELSGYGQSKVLTGDYIPASDIPDFDPRSSIQDFNIQGDRPQFDPTVDMARDPGVAFRRQEQERAINRNMAGMGKLLSGNRMEELMARGGDLASQEYGQAYARNLGEYEVGRAREATGFARDLTGFEQNRLAEEARYGRDVTGYNAEMARENLQYGRGVDEYGRQYGAETDYLNRLANLSNVGQQTAMGMGRMGAQTAAGIGANTVSAGNTQAAAQIGQASAWQNAIGDLTAMGTQYAMRQNQPSYGYNPSNPSGSFQGDYTGTQVNPNTGRPWGL